MKFSYLSHCQRDRREVVMSDILYVETLKVCYRYAGRLQWAMTEMQKHVPFASESLENMKDVEIAILDQFSMRFSKLQDVMDMKLFPAVLELSKEQGNLDAFIDKLNRLEKNRCD